MKKALSLTVGTGLLAMSMAASAAFQISGGEQVTLGSGGKDPFNPSGGSEYNGKAGSVGADITWSGSSPAEWEFTFLGKEASWTNIFSFSDGGTDSGGSATYTKVFDNKVDVGTTQWSSVSDFGFEFSAKNGNKGSVTNLSAGTSAPTFWAMLEDNNTLVLWFSDSGNSDDRDFDDMGVRISAVPVPAALPLFVSALAGLGFVGYRRRKP